MDRQILNFTANEQVLTVSNPIRISTNKVNYIEAHFALGQNWQGYDSVRAVWFNDYQTISTVLDSQGVCRVPFEVMKRKGQVKVDLVGSISEGDVLTDRLTSYPVVAVIVDCVAPIQGAETSPITPSQFEQFVANVRADADRAEAGAEGAETSAGEASASAQSASTSASDAQTYAQNAEISATDAESAKDDAIDAKEDAEEARDEIRSMRAEATTLSAGSDATASYSNGLLSLGIPRGDKGEKGDKGDTGATPNLSIGTVETLPPTGTSEVTITGTAENPVLNFKLVKGDTGEVTMAQLAQLLPTDTASGDIASFPDGQDVIGALSVLTTIEPIQSGSGTPSPSNIRPITGHDSCVTSVVGKNLFDKSTSRYIYVYGRITTGDTLYAEQTTTGQWSVYVAYEDGTQAELALPPNTKRSISITKPVNRIAISEYAFNKINSENADLMVSLSDFTEIEPYNGNTYTTNLGRTVYGGSLDVVSGVLTVDRALITIDENSDIRTPTDKGTYMQFLFVGTTYIVGGASGIANCKCNAFEPKNSDALGSIRIRNASSTRDVFLNVSTEYDTVDKLKTWLASNNVQLVAQLVTPQTYQLTPQEVELLLGQNNVWTDCGSVEVTYKADTYLWVEKKLS